MVAEFFRTLQSKTTHVRAGFRISVPEILAGAPLEIEFNVENRGETPFCLAVGAERAALRPAFFSFAVSLEKANVRLDDPAEAMLDIGGPVGVVRVEPGTTYQLPLLLNEFVRLERSPTVLSPGQSDSLSIVCRRPLPPADQENEALNMGDDAPTVEGTLRVRVRRDDAAFKTLITELADQARAATLATGERERALLNLIALRSPSARPSLQAFARDPDPSTQMLARRGLAALDAGPQGKPQ